MRLAAYAEPYPGSFLFSLTLASSRGTIRWYASNIEMG